MRLEIEQIQNYKPLVSLMDQYWYEEEERAENYAGAMGRGTR